MHECFVFMYVCVSPSVPGALEGQKKAMVYRDLELWAVVGAWHQT